MPNHIGSGSETGNDTTIDVPATLRGWLRPGESGVDIRGMRPEGNLSLWIGVTTEPVFPLFERKGTMLRKS